MVNIFQPNMNKTTGFSTLQGTLNKTTKEAREFFKVLGSNLNNINQWLEQDAKDDPAKVLKIIKTLLSLLFLRWQDRNLNVILIRTRKLT